MPRAADARSSAPQPRERLLARASAQSSEKWTLCEVRSGVEEGRAIAAEPLDVDQDGPQRFRPEVVADAISEGIELSVRELGRRGAIVAVSGGIDSSVVAALCVKALGTDRVLLLRLPERGLSESSSDLGLELAQQLGARSVEEPISPVLEALGCYRMQEEAIRSVFPDFDGTWRHKLVRSAPTGGVIVFSLVVQSPDGVEQRRRMPPDAYRLLLSATNMKQRARKLIEYTWADRLGYAVAGTPNLLEYDQGFFVKGGDGLADIKPIAALYKQQVYALAEYLRLPAGITSRQPTTETFTLPQSQEEFYFGFPYEQMDLLLWGEINGVDAARLASRVRLQEAEVEAAYREIKRRRTATAYLHADARVIDADGSVR
jgi:NAD+ synthase